MFLVKQQMDLQVPLKSIRIKKLLCQQNNEVLRICSNQACQFDAFCCREESCRTCAETHEECSFRQLSQLTKRIQNKLKLEQNLLEDMFSLEKDLIDHLRETRRELIQTNDSKNQNGKFHNLVYKILEENRVEGLKGSDMNLFFNSIPLSFIEKQQKRCVEEYKSRVDALEKDLILARQTIFDSFYELDPTGKSKIQERVKISQSQSAQIPKTQDFPLDSFILLKDEDSKDKILFILKELESPTELKLLFRASQHNYESLKFHQICNGIGDTLTIIKTQYNKTIAGFTKLPWNKSNYYVKDPDASSFLLHLDSRQRMNLKKKNKALYSNQHFGPSFGSDIVIADRCNMIDNQRNTCSFPNNYSQIEEIKDKDKARQSFCGCPNGKKFRIVEYEVFQVIK